MRKCPCCKNPWQQSAECFALSCDACLTDESAKGLDPANMDTSVSPAVDFFAHANGGWQKANPIPAEYPAWNTFISLHDQNLGRLRDLLEQLPPPPPDDGACEGGGTKGAASKVAAFWSAAMDEGAIELAGTKPLAPMLAACDAAATDKTAALASLHAQAPRCTPRDIPLMGDTSPRRAAPPSVRFACAVWSEGALCAWRGP